MVKGQKTSVREAYRAAELKYLLEKYRLRRIYDLPQRLIHRTNNQS